MGFSRQSEWVNKILLYSRGNYIQYLVINHNEKEYEKEYVYIELSHFAIQQKLTQPCKSHTSIKFKKHTKTQDHMTKKHIDGSKCKRERAVEL